MSAARAGSNASDAVGKIGQIGPLALPSSRRLRVSLVIESAAHPPRQRAGRTGQLAEKAGGPSASRAVSGALTFSGTMEQALPDMRWMREAAAYAVSTVWD